MEDQFNIQQTTVRCGQLLLHQQQRIVMVFTPDSSGALIKSIAN